LFLAALREDFNRIASRKGAKGSAKAQRSNLTPPVGLSFSALEKNLIMKSPLVIAVGGFASEVGKTTLMCQLLRALPGWEAIKTTRGHYRSCGKDPHACCVSHLLADEPVVLSGRERTYAPGKDTGRYWDAGAKNVHWMIATEQQVERGIKQALARVRSEGVLVEGNSFAQYVDVRYFIMVTRGNNPGIKASARRALSKASALYLSDETDSGAFHDWSKLGGLRSLTSGLPLYNRESLPQMVADVCRTVPQGACDLVNEV
jgi:molybdopterin-guanine dinucleotide biosynthesis protein